MAYLLLGSPCILNEQYQYTFFDAAHDHLLLYIEAYFYTLSYNDASPTPRMFYHQEDLPSKIALCKISLDLEIIAVQTSPTSVLVIDTINKRKWAIDIKYPEENVILSEGIIWSDHGGHSQDLIIVTTRGLELYKVSLTRGQCKLSRTISHAVYSFWYQPSHRMILMASFQGNPQAMSSSGKKQQLLNMDGYFFKFGKSMMPKMELPLPDKLPKFELGPGVSVSDIGLEALYGRLYCLVHYTEHGQDNISMYQLTRTSVTRTHTLSLNHCSESLSYCVLDNLLVCHCYSGKVSFVFDIMRSPRSRKPSENSPLLDVIEPLCSPCSLHYSDTIRRDSIPRHIIQEDSAPSRSNGSNVISEGSVVSVPLTANPLRKQSTAASPVATLSQSKDYSKGKGSSGQTQGDGHGQQSSGGEVSSMDDWTAVRASGTLSRGRSITLANVNQAYLLTGQSNIKDFKSLIFTASPSLPSGNKTAGSKKTTYRHLERPIPALEMYEASICLCPSKDFVWDTNRNIMWRLKMQYDPITAAQWGVDNNDFSYQERVLFLSRRGLKHHFMSNGKQEGDVCIEYGHISSEGQVGKQLLLCKMYETIENMVSLSHLVDLFASMVMSYSSKERFLRKVRNQFLVQQPPGHDRTIMGGGLMRKDSTNGHSSSCSGPVAGVHIDDHALTNVHMTTGLTMSIQSRVGIEPSAPSLQNEKSGNHASPSSSSSLSPQPNSNSHSHYSAQSLSTKNNLLSRRNSLSDGVHGILQSYRRASFTAQSNMRGAGQSHNPRLSRSFQIDSDPLEPMNVVQSFMPDIAVVLGNVRKVLESVHVSYPTASVEAQKESVSNQFDEQERLNQKVVGQSLSKLSFVKQMVDVPQQWSISAVYETISSDNNDSAHTISDSFNSASISSAASPSASSSTSTATAAIPAHVSQYALNTRRDLTGHLIVSQSEALSHVWFPLFLHASVDALDSYCSALLLYLSALREAELAIVPPLSILLIRVLLYTGQVQEAYSLVQLDNFFSPSIEVAFALLEASDELGIAGAPVAPSLAAAYESDWVPLSQHAENMQQVGLHMLWRLNERMSVVKWYLSHGMVIDAISLCMKKLGQWKSSIGNTISGIDFFSSAVVALENVTSREEILVHHRMDRCSKFMTARYGMYSGGESDEGVKTLKSRFKGEVERSFEAERIEILYSVHQFISEWDGSVLAVGGVGGHSTSRLASQTSFPSHLFQDKRVVERFKTLFGFDLG